MSALKQAVDGMSNQIQRTAGSIGKQLQTTTDKWIPPKERELKLKQLRSFSRRNPKLATFLAAQSALLGIPILLFISFAISTLFISLSACLLFAVTTSLIYTFFAVGFALMFLIPTLFVASFAASCFFLWGLAVYLVLQRFNDGEAPVKRGTRVGDKFQGLTGGRLDWMVDGKDTKAVEVGHVKKLLHTNGGDAGYESYDGANDSHHGGDGFVNGAGEWEAKWARGTQECNKEFVNGLGDKVDELKSEPSENGLDRALAA